MFRCGHARVLLPAELLLQAHDRERAVHHRGEQLPGREAVRAHPCRLPAALRPDRRLQVSSTIHAL